MSDPLHIFKQTLKDRGFSLTETRQTVFEALQNTEPLSMRELVSRCGNLDRASVYRVIILFEDLHIVQRLQIGWKYKLELTDTFVRHHHHLTCLHCGVITALPEDWILEERLRSLAEAQDFMPRDHQLEIRGLCVNCRPRRA